MTTSTKDITDITHDLHAMYIKDGAYTWHELDITEPTLDGAVDEAIEFWNKHPDAADEFVVASTLIDDTGHTHVVEVKGTIYDDDDEVGVIVHVVAEETNVELLGVHEIAERCVEVLDGISAVFPIRDDDDNPVMTHVVFADDTRLIAADDIDDDTGFPTGCTWTIYADVEALIDRDGATDSSPRRANLREKIISLAARATQAR